MNFQEWLKTNPDKSINDYYKDQYNVKDEDLPTPTVKPNADGASQTHYHFYQPPAGVTDAPPTKSNDTYKWIVLMAAALGLYAHQLPFLHINTASIISDDMGLIGKTLVKTLNLPNISFSVNNMTSSLRQYGGNGSALAKVDLLINIQRVSLCGVILFGLMGSLMMRKTIELCFVATIGIGFAAFLSSDATNFLEFLQGSYFLVLTSMVFAADILNN